MIVYHGTTPNRAKSIICEGILHCTSDKYRKYESTKAGYVYVTGRLCDAMDFSTRPEIGLTQRKICVFRINIADCQLKPDVDEKKWRSTLSQEGADDCYTISHDLVVGREINGIFVKDFGTDNRLLGEYLVDIQNSSVIVGNTEWYDLGYENNNDEVLKHLD